MFCSSATDKISLYITCISTCSENWKQVSCRTELETFNQATIMFFSFFKTFFKSPSLCTASIGDWTLAFMALWNSILFFNRFITWNFLLTRLSFFGCVGHIHGQQHIYYLLHSERLVRLGFCHWIELISRKLFSSSLTTFTRTIWSARLIEQALQAIMLWIPPCENELDWSSCLKIIIL